MYVGIGFLTFPICMWGIGFLTFPICMWGIGFLTDFHMKKHQTNKDRFRNSFHGPANRVGKKKTNNENTGWSSRCADNINFEYNIPQI